MESSLYKEETKIAKCIAGEGRKVFLAEVLRAFF